MLCDDPLQLRNDLILIALIGPVDLDLEQVTGLTQHPRAERREFQDRRTAHPPMGEEERTIGFKPGPLEADEGLFNNDAHQTFHGLIGHFEGKQGGNRICDFMI